MLVRFALLCDFSNDGADGKLNLFGVTETVFATSFPALHKHCHFVVSYQWEASDVGRTYETTVEFVDPDGVQILNLKHPIADFKRPTVVNHRHVIHDLQIPVAGAYQFNVKVEGQTMYSRMLEASLLPVDNI